MQRRLFDPGPMDFSSERAREAFDDEWWGKDILLWTDDGIIYKTAPYRGTWRGFHVDGFFGSIMGVVEESPGVTTNVGPSGIIHIAEHNPLLAAEQALERFLEEVGWLHA